MGKELEELIEETAELIVSSKKLVVFTGAGVSTESGIPDFRSPGGIWSKFNPDDFTYQKFLKDPKVRKRQWQMFSMFRMIDLVQPNPAHYAIAELDKLGKLDCVITQNVDGLHQKAGVPEEKVIELHGTTRWVKCLGCGKRYPMSEIAKRLEAGVEEPVCDDCGGILKSATISFGEPMPVKETSEAERCSRECDLMMVVGSSLVVYPAAYMPIYAMESGAKLVIINVGTTSMDRFANVRINEKAGEVMSKILERVKSRLA
ncbi:MAG: NAD-dependent protein deacylase [Dehalococcoidia bacterium]|nr:MAG: NAD-dependent protein deacylase [Dehalococcoidia bacterium]